MPEQSSLQHASGEGDGGPPEDKSESDVEASDVESSEGFRVSVDLSAYWSAPAACLVWVPRAAGCARRVRWLARRVRRAAALRRPFCLLCGARALPPAEPLRMLRVGDQLRVVPVEHEWQQAFSFPADDPPPDPVFLPESTKKRHRKSTGSQMESEVLMTSASSEPTRKHRRSRGEPEPTLASSESTREQGGSRAERAFASPEPREAEQKRRKRNTLPEASPPQVFETEMQTEPAPAAEGVHTESSEVLERMKRRAFELLQRMECGGDEPDGGGPVPDGGPAPDGRSPAPARKRRRRVRRRRAPGPAEPSLVPPETPAPSPVPAECCASPAAGPVSPAPPVSPRPPLPPASPAPPLLRNPTPPRPPRLVRPLPAPSADDAHDKPEPPPAAPAPPAPPAVQCN